MNHVRRGTGADPMDQVEIARSLGPMDQLTTQLLGPGHLLGRALSAGQPVAPGPGGQAGGVQLVRRHAIQAGDLPGPRRPCRPRMVSAAPATISM